MLPSPNTLIPADSPHWRVVLLALIVGLAGCSDPSWGPGVIAPAAPEQEDTYRDSWTLDEYEISPLAEFSIRARMLGVKNYSRGREAELSPVDVALGWGNMSDEQVLSNLKISQSGRWYHYRWASHPPLPVSEIIRYSANMHLIPATPAVARQMEDLRAGDVLVIEGVLVSLRSSDGWRWKSSTSRRDSGAGACELVWVERLEVEPAPVD